MVCEKCPWRTDCELIPFDVDCDARIASIESESASQKEDVTEDKATNG